MRVEEVQFEIHQSQRIDPSLGARDLRRRNVILDARDHLTHLLHEQSQVFVGTVDGFKGCRCHGCTSSGGGETARSEYRLELPLSAPRRGTRVHVGSRDRSHRYTNPAQWIINAVP